MIEQRQFESMTTGQQLYAIAKSIDAALTMGQRQFEAMTQDQQLYVIYEASGGTTISQRFFERLSTTQQLEEIFAFYPTFETDTPYFLSLSQDQQLWEWYEFLASLSVVQPIAVGSFTSGFDFERAMAAGFTGDGEVAFQREAAIDVLRNHHFVDDEEGMIIEDDPTPWQGVAPTGIVVVPGDGQIDSASWNNLPVMVNVDHWRYRFDNTGSWTNTDTNSLANVSILGGSHILNVQAVSDSGVNGATGNSSTFIVVGPVLVASDDFTGAGPQAGDPLTDRANWATQGVTNTQWFGDTILVGSNNGPNHINYYITPIAGQDQRAELTIVSWSFVGGGPAVRCQTGSNSCYGIRGSGVTGGIMLVVCINGVEAFTLESTDYIMANGGKLAIKAVGLGAATRLSVEVDTGSGWTPIAALTNVDPGVGNYLDGGQWGVYGTGSNAGGVNTFDDFKGINL